MSLKAYNPDRDPMNPANGYIDNLRSQRDRLQKQLSSRTFWLIEWPASEVTKTVVREMLRREAADAAAA